MTTSPTSHFIYANGLQQHVLEWVGEREPTAVAILLHGYMDAAGTWDLVAPALTSASFRVIAPDVRGFGEASHAVQGHYYYFADYIADLEALLEEMSLFKDPVLPLFMVGHSMGGIIGTLYTATFPEHIARLALLEGLGPPSEPLSASVDCMRNWLKEMKVIRATCQQEGVEGMPLEEAYRRLCLRHPRVDADVLRSRLSYLTKSVGEDRIVWCVDPRYKAAYPYPFRQDYFRAFAERIAQPVLYIHGGPTGFRPPDEKERLASFANLTQAELNQAGHMMQWTQAAQVARLLIRFWGQGRVDDASESG
ncbi:alpha/beta fold hydrolase [Pajaroellobacter abortibovis]|uniref:AB hydrolase-1 domain-containing protein n=1 Tax=Pajaroellobacter abortibovis TaxID=1882918 RepID=A0A1L6MVB6_9BACT|nr:alpha/beta hydrolase [Pajaroellobacter abortibovis]APR99421.1 hypothetical protein BCY86_01035 [Pajaroellobacter abortibovis]